MNELIIDKVLSYERIIIFKTKDITVQSQFNEFGKITELPDNTYLLLVDFSHDFQKVLSFLVNYSNVQNSDDLVKHAEPQCVISESGLVLLPVHVRFELGCGHISFVKNKDGKYEIWTDQEVQDYLFLDRDEI